MAKIHQDGRTASHRIACNVSRDRTGYEAEGTANVLDSMAHNFVSMLKAQDPDGLDDREIDHIEKAQEEVAMAAKRLHAIARRCINAH